MFSQLRQAVENLQDRDVEETRPEAPSSRSNSLDSSRLPSSPLSSSQLAESALNNLRKSLATQRSGSVGSIPRSPALSPPREGRTKSTLEDRLRAAAFAIGDASTASNSIEASRRPSLSASPAARNSSQSLPPENRRVDSTDQNDQTSSSSSTLNTTLKETNVQNADGAGISDHTLGITVETDSSSPPPTSVVSLIDDVEAEQPENKNIQIPELPTDTSAHPTSPEEKPYTSTPQSIQHHDPPEQQDIPSFTPSNFEGSAIHAHKDVLSFLSNEVHAITLEDLQEKLKQVEQKFTDVSASFKRLQAEKQAADLVLQELTPVEGIEDSLTLRDYLQNLKTKNQVLQDEVKRVSGKLQIQEARVDELQDMRHRESSSQSAQIEKLRTQLSEAEALLQASYSSNAQTEEASAQIKLEMNQLHKELERSQLLAKEEEEKRVKAISLLKTVRQKLVKAEKEKEDAAKEKAELQVREKEEREKGEAEKAKLRNDIENKEAEREKAITGLKTQFDRELSGLKDRHEKELTATRGQYELESAAKKNVQSQEISTRDAQIRALEQTLAQVSQDKNTFFDDLQLRQAELESAQSHLESLQSQNTEYQYQLRELTDRFMLLKEDMADAQREQETRPREPVNSVDEMAQALSIAEAKYEMKISELKRNLITIEKERNDSEAEWSQKLRDKIRELEDLKILAGSASKAEQEHEEVFAELKAQANKLEGERHLLEEQLHSAWQRDADVREIEMSWRSQEENLTTKIAALERLVEEGKQRETQLRLGNKTLREELRKVQSSVALLERQRNPGVGYWTSRSNESNLPTSHTSVNPPLSDVAPRSDSPESTSKEKAASEEDVNLEYLRNVILQFLEHKEMRPNLVKVLSIILRFTPQETRRLVAKV